MRRVEGNVRMGGGDDDHDDYDNLYSVVACIIKVFRESLSYMQPLPSQSMCSPLAWPNPD